MASEIDERYQMLVVVVDINPNQILFAKQQESFSKMMNCVLTFINSHLMLHSTNRAALVAAHATGCSYLYPDPSSENQLLRQQDGQYEEFFQLETVVRKKVQKLLTQDMESKKSVGGESLLSGALCMALTYINRMKSSLGSSEKLFPRLLIVSSSGDSASQYMNYMNAFFTAQKMNVPLDCCMLMQDSGLLQQGCDITGGAYFKVEQLQGLLQYLSWIFLPAPPLRKMLGGTPPVKVDYRAACFCHRQLVEIGFVCSVCLSIFCRFSPVCITCHSMFQAPNLLPAKRKKNSAAQKRA